ARGSGRAREDLRPHRPGERQSAAGGRRPGAAAHLRSKEPGHRRDQRPRRRLRHHADLADGRAHRVDDGAHRLRLRPPRRRAGGVQHVVPAPPRRDQPGRRVGDDRPRLLGRRSASRRPRQPRGRAGGAAADRARAGAADRRQHLGRLGRSHPPDAVEAARCRSSTRGAPTRLARDVLDGTLSRRARGHRGLHREATGALHAAAQRRHAAVLPLVALTDWAFGALVVAVASFVMGLAGFGVGLVGLAFLPYVMSPATAIVLLTLYSLAFAVGLLVQLRDDFRPAQIRDLVIGTVLGTPLGVWGLASLPASLIDRLIGALLIVVVVLEWRGLFPTSLPGRWWGLGTGALAGVLGGAVGTPGPPVIVYSTTQGWTPRTMKANLQAFFVVNQAVILAGYWWAGLLSPEVVGLGMSFAIPAAI